MRTSVLGRLTAVAVISGAVLVPIAAAADPASTLYVDNTAACSNTGSGTLAQPYCTIAAASAVVTAGQTVEIAGGPYAEPLIVPASGTPGHPITFIKSGTALVAVTGITVDGQHDVSIQGFRVVGPATAPGLRLSDSADLTITAVTVSGTGAGIPAIDLTGVTDSSLNTVSAAGYAGSGYYLDAGTSHVTFNRAYADAAQNSGATDGFVVAGSANSINNSSVSTHIHDGIDLIGPGNTVTGGNLFTNIGAAIGVEPGAANSTIVDNSIQNSPGDGIDVTGATGTVIADNQLTRGSGTAIAVSGATGTAITSNTVDESCGGIRVGGDSTGVSVQNNVDMPDGWNGYAVACTTGSTPVGIAVTGAAVGSTTVDYNTIQAPAGASPYIWSTPVASLAAAGQGAHDSVVTSANGSANIDSANSAAPGEPATDRTGRPREDDPGVANTGTGSITYADRGATELTGSPYPQFAVNTTVSTLTATIDASYTVRSSWAPIATYTFGFGDGSAPVTQAGPIVTHRYAHPGEYVVTVTAVDIHNGSGVRTQNLDLGYALHTVPQHRILSTHTGIGVPGTAPLGAGRTLSLNVVAGGAVPADAKAVVIDVTATRSTKSGHLTVYADGTTRPGLSSVHFTAGKTVPSTLTVPIVNGKIDFYNSSTGTVDVIADLAGYYAPSGDSQYNSMTERVLTTSVKAHATLAVPVAKLIPGVDASLVTALALSVTASHDTGAGYLEVYDSYSGPPATSSLHWTSTAPVTNLIVVSVHNKMVDFYNGSGGTVTLTGDLEGYFSQAVTGTAAAGMFIPVTPVRALDHVTVAHGTASATIPGLPAGGTSAVLVNVSVAATKSSGHVSVAPGGGTYPTTNVSWSAGQTLSAFAIVPVVDGRISIANVSSGSTEILVDVVGYFGTGN